MVNTKGCFQILCLLALCLILATGCSEKPKPTEKPDEPKEKEVIEVVEPVVTPEPAELEVVAVEEAKEADIWTQDFEAAKKQAAEQGKDLLVDFTGSDWCGWCVRLDKEVFSQKAFIDEAPKHFVLVKLDYPRDKTLITEKVKAQNAELKTQYSISGYPTILLMDAKGVPYARTGYQKDGPESYNKHLAELRKTKDTFASAIAKANDAEGTAKAKLIDEALQLIPAEIAAQFHGDKISQIIELDANNEAGLKVKYQMSRRMDEMQNAMKAGDWNKAIELTDAIITDFKPTGEELQDIYFGKSQCQFRMDNKDAAKKTLEAAIAIAPDSQTAANMKSTLARIFPEPVEEAAEVVEAVKTVAAETVAETETEEAAKEAK